MRCSYAANAHMQLSVTQLRQGRKAISGQHLVELHGNRFFVIELSLSLLKKSWVKIAT